MNYVELAAQLRQTRAAEEQARASKAAQGGAALTNGGQVGGSMFQTGGMPNQGNDSPMGGQNPLQQGLDAFNKYKTMGSGAGGAFTGATPATMSAMGTGGGSSLGSMGLMSSAPAVSFPGATTAAPAASGAGAGALGAGGMLAGLAGLSWLGDKEMNENKGSMINADKLNNMGTIGGSGIGFRGGDLVNGFNPATWLSDPKKAGKGLVNAFTFGLADKVFDLF